MAKTNKKGADYRKEKDIHLAGGYGVKAAKQDVEMQLRRAVLACLLWEDLAYQGGKDNADNISVLVPQVDPIRVAELAIEARTKQKLRHVPLYLAVEMLKHNTHKGQVGKLLPQIIRRADELTEFVSLYWKEGRKPLAAQAKKGLAVAFQRFNEYQLGKYNRDEKVKLRDVLFLSHAKPANEEQEKLWKRLIDGTLETPDTWEVSLSTGKDKKETWERLITDDKLGALAFLRNLRNMQRAKVSESVIAVGFDNLKTEMLLPLNFFSAALVAPDWMGQIEKAMLASLGNFPELSGKSVFVVDVSGSMDSGISGKSNFSRQDVACAMAVMAAEMCERVSIYATAGDDPERKHATAKVKPYRGFALSNEIKGAQRELGGGGIFTRQCLEYIRGLETEVPDRIIIFSDSQDCDIYNSKVPAPFGKRNYIVDVSAHSHGINYDGIWTAELSGWSEHFLEYISAVEGLQAG